MYYLLTESFKNQEEKLVTMILETVQVEKIYMLGSCLEQKRTESIFVTTAPSVKKVGHYYLLVLIDKDKSYGENYVQDKIENTCRSFIPVTAIVLNIAKFNNWLNEGHRFACTVVKIAVLIYERVKMPLVIPKEVPKEIDKKINEAYYLRAIDKVNQFISGADFFKLRMQNKMAAFMLHQATEHALHAIFKKATGLYLNTHNIDKLVRYCSMILYKIPAIFSRENDKDEKLIGLLQKAYIDTFYKDDFTITNNDLVTILESVKILPQLMAWDNKNEPMSK